MTDEPAPRPEASRWPLAALAAPTLTELQHWTGVIGRAQQMVLEHAVAARAAPAAGLDLTRLFTAWPVALPTLDAPAIAAAQQEAWHKGAALWQRFLDPAAERPQAVADRRFAAPVWREHPAFDLVRQLYQIQSDALLRQVDAVEGLDERGRERLRFVTRAAIDAASPANFALTNPEALQRIVETRGESFLAGLHNLLADLAGGQLTHTRPGAFELGRDLAATPGKVILQTALFQLIQYAPATERVRETPLLIFPPWINRFYILDLGPRKSFVKWATEQGLTVFMVSWKSADATMADITLDDYAAAQLEAIEVVRALLGRDGVHVIGYCVAGTVLAATLALLAARGQQDRVTSATFLTTQVDFAGAGDLGLFVDDRMLDLVEQLAADRGFLDGRYMAATFNLLRGRELIWNYVVQHYLMGEDYPAFDLLHWNADTTNLPARWHRAYLRDFYRDNLLVRPDRLRVLDTAIDLTRVTVPAYVQAGRDDHIAPAASVWQITRHLRGPIRFVLAGSGHIAGVVNPPAGGKYQYWSFDEPAASFADFVGVARETKGSWWPDWARWIGERGGDAMVPASGARIPGEGALPAIEDAPGRYVRSR